MTRKCHIPAAKLSPITSNVGNIMTQRAFISVIATSSLLLGQVAIAQSTPANVGTPTEVPAQPSPGAPAAPAEASPETPALPAEVPVVAPSTTPAEPTPPSPDTNVIDTEKTLETSEMEKIISERVDAKIADEFPVKASYGKKGFRLESRDGNWQTNLQWRAQLRFTNPSTGDPRQVSNFKDDRQSTIEARRLRMKIGGHGYQPWLGYYFEVDLQPTRSIGDSSSNASARVIDWRITVAKWKEASLRVGQWKIDHNRERVDSSGRQQFVERSIVNRIFTIDRQVGLQLRGNLFKDTYANLRYYAGIYTGQGRGVRNDDSNMMYAGRLQWNFLSRDLKWRQTDVEYTEKPTGSLAFSGMSYKGACTRWSSSGCGNLDGYEKAADAAPGQYEIQQMMEEFAFKWRGLSLQQEFHWKKIKDTDNGTESTLTGAYAQAGYFFHYLAPAIPKPLEIAARVAFVDEPNVADRTQTNTRQEFTVGANWFFAGHNNKITADFTHHILDDAFASHKHKENRVRVQWDVSF